MPLPMPPAGALLYYVVKRPREEGAEPEILAGPFKRGADARKALEAALRAGHDAIEHAIGNFGGGGR